MKEHHIHDHLIEELISADGMTPEEFTAVRQELKIIYSQPAYPQSNEQIKAHADDILDEHPLTIKRGEEVITYDKSGRPVTVMNDQEKLTRDYDKLGFISREVLETHDERLGEVEEVRTFSYGFQRGKRTVQRIKIEEFRISTDKKDRVATHKPYSINLSDLLPFSPTHFTLPNKNGIRS